MLLSIEVEPIHSPTKCISASFPPYAGQHLFPVFLTWAIIVKYEAVFHFPKISDDESFSMFFHLNVFCGNFLPSAHF